MKLNDSIDMKGRMTLRLHDREGRVVREVAADNDIVLTGRDLVAKLFAKIDGATPISHIAVGTGTNQIDPTKDEKLGSELFRKTINPITTKDIVATTDGKMRVTISAELNNDEANGPLTEAGMFNDPLKDTGVMYNRVKFDVVNKTSDFRLTIVWEILF